MPTRRQILEDALVLERVHLWDDFVDTMARIGVASDPCDRIVGRIRNIGEALGYPSDPEMVPVGMLAWYWVVENVPELGLHVHIPGELVDAYDEAVFWMPADDSLFAYHPDPDLDDEDDDGTPNPADA